MTYSGEYENCPEIEKLIAGKERGLIRLETKPVRIDGTDDVENIRLVFPFASCKEKERK
jgi:hypothetical protein